MKTWSTPQGNLGPFLSAQVVTGFSYSANPDQTLFFLDEGNSKFSFSWNSFRTCFSDKGVSELSSLQDCSHIIFFKVIKTNSRSEWVLVLPFLSIWPRAFCPKREKIYCVCPRELGYFLCIQGLCDIRTPALNETASYLPSISYGPLGDPLTSTGTSVLSVADRSLNILSLIRAWEIGNGKQIFLFKRNLRPF